MPLKEEQKEATAACAVTEAPARALEAIVPVLLAGGAGRRLWSLSRPDHPKPFLKLKEGGSYFQKTLERVSELAAPVVICGNNHYELVQKQAAESKARPRHVFLEPEGRNTGAAVAVAAHYYKASGKEEQVLLILPTDHEISFPEAFLSQIAQALPLARQNKIVLFGVKLAKAEKGYGYIRLGRKQDDDLYKVSRFVEKPGKAEIKKYLHKGGWLWNSGIVMAKAGRLADAIEKSSPELYKASYEAVARAARRQEAVILNETHFAACPEESFDRAVLENARGLVVVAGDLGWDDIGTWPRLIRRLVNILKR